MINITLETYANKWKYYYETVVPYIYNNEPYMFAMSGKAKRWFISKLSTDKNDINTEIISGEWGNFFGAVAVFYVGGTPFLYAQTATSKKKWFVSELSVDKKVVEKEIISGNWDHYYGSVYL